MRYWHIVFVALPAAFLTLVFMCLAPNVTLWPFVAFDGPLLLFCKYLPDTYYLVLTPIGAALLFSIYAFVVLKTRGRVRWIAAFLITACHVLCCVAAVLALPNPPY